ncbi:MAG: enoyl-CoA hydratase/isomerase family protein [Solirubrobacterales bacterium]
MLQVGDHEKVRSITLDRTDKLNAFDVPLEVALAAALGEAAADPELSVAVITAAGRAFSAGVDRDVEAVEVAGSMLEPFDAFELLVDALADFPKPLIFAVNGLAVGMGATILALGDLVLMARGARVRFPFAQLGIVPEAGSTFTLPALLGQQRAAWMLMSSEWFDAEQCKRFGLALEVHPESELEAAALARATTLAQGSLASLVATKRALIAARADRLDSARRLERESFERIATGH